MDPSAKFSLLLFSPHLVALLLPVMLLFPIGIFFTLSVILDPTLSISQALGFAGWVIGPIIAAACLYLIGRWLHTLTLSVLSPRITFFMAWLIFTATLFFALWFDITLLGSISASDKPIRIYLSSSAIVAAGLTLLAQAAAIPWLGYVSKYHSGPQGTRRIFPT
jgi:hypothetical protein